MLPSGHGTLYCNVPSGPYCAPGLDTVGSTCLLGTHVLACWYQTTSGHLGDPAVTLRSRLDAASIVTGDPSGPSCAPGLDTGSTGYSLGYSCLAHGSIRPPTVFLVTQRSRCAPGLDAASSVVRGPVWSSCAPVWTQDILLTAFATHVRYMVVSDLPRSSW